MRVTMLDYEAEKFFTGEVLSLYPKWEWSAREMDEWKKALKKYTWQEASEALSELYQDRKGSYNTIKLSDFLSFCRARGTGEAKSNEPICLFKIVTAIGKGREYKQHFFFDSVPSYDKASRYAQKVLDRETARGKECYIEWGEVYGETL